MKVKVRLFRQVITYDVAVDIEVDVHSGDGAGDVIERADRIACDADMYKNNGILDVLGGVADADSMKIIAAAVTALNPV